MRSLFALALVAALALPRVAHAQTPSVTPTPAPVALTIRFDCDSVPWSCGDGPTDVRWQLYESVGCGGGGSQVGCRYVRVGPVVPGQALALWPSHRYKLFLAPNLDRSDRVSRSCAAGYSAGSPYLTIQGECTVYESACAGPQNWQLYADTDAGLVHSHKHIGECSRYPLYTQTAMRWILAWGLPGELAAAPTAATVAATMTAPPASPTVTPTVTPTVGIPTAVPTTAVPTATSSPTTTRTATATPTRAALLLPMVWR